MDRVTYKCEIDILGRTVSMYITCSPIYKKNYIQESFKRAFTWLSIAFQYSPKLCSQQLDVYIYFTDLQKTLPPIGKPIDQQHANTAFTTFCKPKTEIHIFREEEWFKVLIHESFHSLGLDFSEFDHRETNRHILSIFPVKSDVRIFETYCEIWAELINTMFIVFNSTKIPTIDRLVKKLEGCVDKERIFSAFQCVKVLHFYGLDYSDLYEKTEQAHVRRLHRYKENTQVLSYYILKSIFIFYANDFIEWCADHSTKSSASAMNFDKNPRTIHKNMEEYCIFIRDHYKLPEFLSTIYQIHSWYDNIHPHILTSIELKTLRMTTHEI
jgi:hypothetical protein